MSARTPQILLMCEDVYQTQRHGAAFDAAGWSVAAVTDEIEAFAAVRNREVDLAVLHIPLDDMAAMDLPKVLRRVSPWSYMPVVILTSSHAEEKRCRLLDSGADEALCDSTSPAEIVARVRALLRIKQLHDELSASREALEDSLGRERELLAQLRRENKELLALSATDPLTRVQNVRSFHDVLRHEFRMARRYNQPLSLLMLDVDHFKVLNDTHGHPSGDYVLKELAVIFQQSVRESDIVARTGGEEFALVLPRADRRQTAAFAERIRQHVSERKFTVFGCNIHATISIGSACYPADAEIVEPEMLVYFADQALLLAKEFGRDRVISIGEIDGAVRRRLRRQYLTTQTEIRNADEVEAGTPR